MKDSFRHTPFRREQPPNAQRGSMELWLSYIEKSPRNQTPFMFYVVDADTGYGLKGAEFSLFQRDELVFGSYSNRSGAVWFPPLREGLYQLKEAKPPKQYVPEKEAFQMYVDYNGNICIEGVPAARFQVFYKRSSEQKASFSLIKYDIRTGKRLEGAVFQLCQNHVPVATSTSDAEGFVQFYGLSEGVYQLNELCPPEGYMKVSDTHIVVVANDGTVTIDGYAAEYASIGNKPILYDIFFQKQDELTGEPLEGAVFDLLHGGIVLYTAISNEKGEINFGSFAPGTYTLKEQKPPSGYHINEHEYTVVVAQDGMVTIDDMPVEYARIRDKKEQEQITVRKYVQRLEPERGVTFQLSQNDVMVACADTNEQGEAYFHDMKPGTYMLIQLTHDGQSTGEKHTVMIEESGTIIIDNQVTNILDIQ